MKDPAVLFYTSDFITGTLTMTDEQRGKYILLLCLQHQQGYLTEEDMLQICKAYDERIFSKFEKDKFGYYFNERMKKESEKRNKYIESRRNNRQQKSDDMNNICESYVNRMENENININNKENKGAKKFNFDFVEESYKDIFESWLNYKKERKESYKTQTSLEACYKNLKKLSGNNPETAKEIIENSFANNWSGLFALKNNKTFTPAPIVPEFSSGPDR